MDRNDMIGELNAMLVSEGNEPYPAWETDFWTDRYLASVLATARAVNEELIELEAAA